MIECKLINKNKHIEIIDILQSISSFYPLPKNLNRIWNEFIDQKNCFAYCFYDKENLVGYGAFIIETKIRGGKMAHIEDIVVDAKYRNKGVGKEIISVLITKIKNMKCYKASLACKEHNISFYNSCGFEVNGINMSLLL